MYQIRNAFAEERFVLDVDAHDIELILRYAVSQLVAKHLLPIDRRDDVEAALVQRERVVSTAIGHSVAVPHAYLDAFEHSTILFIRLKHPINLGAPDGIATRFVFCLVGPPNSAAEHLDALAGIARLMSDDEFRYELGEAQSRDDLLTAFDHFVMRSESHRTAPVEAVPEGLEYTGRFAGGVFQDLKRRWPHYWDDFRVGLHPKCLAATLFLFFACLAPTVTFGGVMAFETNGEIGPIEMLLATGICGSLYALLSGQPLIILGNTGPLLAFTAILYRMCSDLGIPFLPAYAWVGFWTSLMVVVLALTDVSFVMRYFTRFTTELFAALIAIIYIYEALRALIDVFYELDEQKRHDTALLSVLLALGTLYIATSLSNFRRSRYLRPMAREFLADFGPAIALACMTIVAVSLHEVYLDALPAPESFGTTTGRPWLTDPFSIPKWIWFASIAPALLATVLIFLDQNITARLVNAKHHRLQKGPGYHMDLAIVGTMIGVCSLFGLPWLVAATVRSLNHVRSLATTEEAITHGGERQDRIIHVRETRVTGLVIHLLIGMSVLLLPALQVIPLAALYGLFLYMGIVSMKGNQFFERLSLWLMDKDLYPATHYIRQVPNQTIHKFTALQLACLVLLWAVKVSILGLLFPLFIAVLVPIRILASRFFLPQHLAALESED